MRHHGIRAIMMRPRRVRTTDSRHNLPIAPNLLDRNFTAPAPNHVWLADITYIPTGEGWLYLAAVMDLYSRKIVGWAMRDHLRTELPLAALMMALQHQRPGAGLMHHSDRGVQGRFKRSLQHLYGGKLRWAIGDDIPIEHAGLYCVHQGGHQFHSARIGGSSGR
jgi:transposase InsO family protein